MLKFNIFSIYYQIKKKFEKESKKNSLKENIKASPKDYYSKFENTSINKIKKIKAYKD